MSYFRIFVFRGTYNFDYVEPEAAGFVFHTGKISSCRPGKGQLFFSINGHHGPGIMLIPPGFHFNKNKYVPIPGNDVQFFAFVKADALTENPVSFTL
jgi:hypothetical protein